VRRPNENAQGGGGFDSSSSKDIEHLLGPYKFLLLNKSYGGIFSLVVVQVKKRYIYFGGAFDLQMSFSGK